MSTVLEQRALPEAGRRWQAWLALLAGLLLLYVPTYLDLAGGLWRDEEHAHGPLVLAVFGWIVWRNRAAILASGAGRATLPGAALVAAGLVLYVVGRAVGLTAFEVASHIPVIAGILLIAGGLALARRLAFALVLLAFLVPLPGFILDFFTTPLKAMVSVAVEAILQAAGYPVLRSGVVLQVGDLQMLVADACSGLNSIYSLFAVALVYLYLTGSTTRLRIALLLAAIVPIALAANIVRVVALILIAWHAGEDAAQSFLHDFAGMLVFGLALVMMLGLDALLRRLPPAASGAPAHEAEPAAVAPARRTPWAAYLAAAAMVSTAAAMPMLKPRPAGDAGIDLERAIPAAFGEWRLDPEMVPVPPAPDVQAKLDRIYRQIVQRGYVNARGERMMLTVAYGGDQSDALKAHRQEVCYAAQGFEIHGLSHGGIEVAGRAVPVTRMVAVLGERVEPVTYWFTMGDRVVLGRLERLKVQLASLVTGRVPDGMLVRISDLSGDPAASFAAHESFAGAVFAALPASQATRFLGSGE